MTLVATGGLREEASSRIVVVLPAPFGPRNKDAAGRHVEVQRVERSDCAVALGQTTADDRRFVRAATRLDVLAPEEVDERPENWNKRSVPTPALLRHGRGDGG